MKIQKSVKKVPASKWIFLVLSLFALSLVLYLTNIGDVIYTYKTHTEHRLEIILTTATVIVSVAVGIYIVLANKTAMWFYFTIFALLASFVTSEIDPVETFSEKLRDIIILLIIYGLIGMSFWFFYKPLKEKASRDKAYKYMHYLFFISVIGYTLIFSNALAYFQFFPYKSTSFIFHKGLTGFYLFWASVFYVIYVIFLYILMKNSFLKKHLLWFTIPYFALVFILFTFATGYLIFLSGLG